MASLLPQHTQSDKSPQFYGACLFFKRILKLREKSVIILTFTFFALVCFGGMFFLPDLRDLGIVDRSDLKEQKNNHMAVDGTDVHHLEDTRRLQDKIKDQNIIPPPPAVSELYSTKVIDTDDEKPSNKELIADSSVDKIRREKIVEMTKFAWDMYVKYAWGANELKPISKRGHSANIFGNSKMGATIVDSLDTLHLMGLTEEFNKATEWVKNSFKFDAGADVSVFEINIRFVGGMLAAYALSGEEVFKQKAIEIVDKLLPAFDTATGIPYAIMNLRTGAKRNWAWASGGCSILSEFGSLHLEFAYLSYITNNPVYLEKVLKVRDFVKKIHVDGDVYPNYLNPQTGRWGQRHTSIGALGDSFYEYLIKEYIQNRTDIQAKNMYDESINTIEKKLLQRSSSGMLYIAEMKNNRLEHKMDHLACFAGGMIALGAQFSTDEGKYMKMAAELTSTCHESYDRTSTKIGPEAFRFEGGIEAKAVRPQEMYFIHRPEVVESYFYMWRLTKDLKYKEWAWEATMAIEKHCKVEGGGYSGIKNVNEVPPRLDDVQQSFLLAETFKYLYLIFSPDEVLPLDKYVVNTEAHPIPVILSA